jgi:RNA polymerase sigma-70 factor, ECF subfamily
MTHNKAGDYLQWSDEELVAKVQRGESEYYEEILTRYQQKLVFYAMRIVQDEDAAADVVQEAFIKAYTNIQSFKLGKKFSSWLYRIVHNRAIDYVRKHKKEVAMNDQTWILDAAVDTVDHTQALSDKLREERLHLAIQLLPMDYRMVIQLYFFDDKSYQEIADILRIPSGTVATRLSRGKKLLAQIFGEEL